MAWKSMFNLKRSLFLFGCKIDGDRLFFDLGIFLPRQQKDQLLTTDSTEVVNVVLDDEIVGKNEQIALTNRSFKIEQS